MEDDRVYPLLGDPECLVGDVVPNHNPKLVCIAAYPSDGGHLYDEMPIIAWHINNGWPIPLTTTPFLGTQGVQWVITNHHRYWLPGIIDGEGNGRDYLEEECNRWLRQNDRDKSAEKVVPLK